MVLNTLWTRESALFTITSTNDGTLIKATHGGSVRVPSVTKLHEALVGIGVADVVRDATRYGFFVALQRATSAPKGTSDPVKCAGLLKRAASFVADVWEVAEGTKEKVLFPVLVSAMLETVAIGKDRAKVERKVGAWSEEERQAVIDGNEVIREAYVRLIGKPKSTVDTNALLAMLDEDDEG